MAIVNNHNREARKASSDHKQIKCTMIFIPEDSCRFGQYSARSFTKLC